MEVVNAGLIAVVVALVAALEIKITKLQKTVDEMKQLIEKPEDRALT